MRRNGIPREHGSIVVHALGGGHLVSASPLDDGEMAWLLGVVDDDRTLFAQVLGNRSHANRWVQLCARAVQ